MWCCNIGGRVIGLLLLDITACLYLVQGEVSVSVDVSQSHALPRENVTVVCRLTGNDPELTVFWYKVVRDQEGMTFQELIATGDIVTPLYKALGRFGSKVTPVGMTTLYILSLSLVSSEDSGHYGCYLAENTDVYDSERLEVYKQPAQVSFTNASGGVIRFTEGQPSPVECMVLGVVPSPSVRIWVGDTEYTDQFTRATQTEVLCSGSYGTKENCPLHFLYNIYLRHPHFLPSQPGSDQRIRCEASLEESGYDSVSTELDVIYQSSPQFDCDRVLYTIPGTENYALACRVTCNPSCDWWSWTFEAGGLEYKLRSDGDPGYTHTEVKVKQEVLTMESMVVSLVITEVTLPYFTVYQLQVSNAQGNSSIVLQLREITEVLTQTPTTSKAVMSSSFVHLVTALVLGLAILEL